MNDEVNQKRIIELEQENAHLFNELQNIKGKLDDYLNHQRNNQQVNNERRLAYRQNREKQELSSQIEKSNFLIQEKQATYNDLEQKVDILSDNYLDLQNKVKEKEKDFIDEVNAYLEKEKDLSSKTEQAKENYERNLEEYKNTYRKKEEEIKVLDDKIKEAKFLYGHLSSTYQFLEGKKTLLEREVEDLEQLNKELRDEVRIEEGLLRIVEGKEKALKEEMGILTVEKNELLESLAELRKEHKVLSDENNEIRKNLENKEADLNKREEDLSIKNEYYSSLMKNIQDKQKRLLHFCEVNKINIDNL